MKAFFTLILSIFSVISYSQNYSLINTSRQCLFNDGNYCLRIDSIAVFNNDTSYYNYKQISNYDACFKYNRISWLGKYVIKTSNNNWIFYNINNDSLILKPTHSVGSKWIAGNIFSASDSARVDSVYQTTFLGITDSVKSITVYGCTNSVYCFHQILISKNFGLIKFFDLQSSITVLTLAGITNPNVGLQNLTGADIYNFQVGDEYHTFSFYGYSIANGFFEVYDYEQHNIMSTNSNIASLTVVDSVYELHKTITYNFTTNPISSNTTISSSSTIHTNFYPNSIITKFDNLSNENFIDSMQCSSGVGCVNAYVQGITDGFESKTTAFYGGCDFGYNGANNCLADCIIDGIPYNFYTKKMGGPYHHSLPNWGANSGSVYYPVYHKRGNVVEGTPIDFLGILLGVENKQNDSLIKIYPNPANDIITISNNTAINDIEIYNSVGLLVLKTQLQQINISNLASGFYHIKIIKNDNTFVEKRFVKQ